MSETIINILAIFGAYYLGGKAVEVCMWLWEVWSEFVDKHISRLAKWIVNRYYNQHGN